MSLKVAKELQDRLIAGLATYQSVVQDLAWRDISEIDTLSLVKDMLGDLFGYDKYLDVARGEQILGMYCDLTICVDEKIQFLAEVRSAARPFIDENLRPIASYAAHQGAEWFLLTNAIIWKIYRVNPGPSIGWKEVICFDVRSLSPDSADDMGKLTVLCRESLTRATMDGDIADRESVAGTMDAIGSAHI